jgi:dihydrofolate reductase
MRKIVVLSFITLDGVMQAPGGPEEDTSGGFKYGGWSFVYGDDTIGELMVKQIGGQPFDLLVGRKTYDIFAGYWPKQKGEIGDPFNKVRKYVVSHEQIKLDWEPNTLITGDVVSELKKLKQEDGPMLQVHGSGNLIQTLLKNELVDELWLKTYPIILGTGKKLFAEGTVPATFELTESSVSPKGVIIANYKYKSNEIKTGSFT